MASRGGQKVCLPSSRPSTSFGRKPKARPRRVEESEGVGPRLVAWSLPGRTMLATQAVATIEVVEIATSAAVPICRVLARRGGNAPRSRTTTGLSCL